MGSEIVTIQQATPLVVALLNTTNGILNRLRMGGTVSAAERQALKDRLAAIRASEVSRALTDLGLQNMRHMMELYDLAATRDGMPDYARALATAAHATRLLEDNLDDLARRLR